MYFDTRKAKIYKDMYRPSTRISRFLGAILSILLVGKSQVGIPDYHHLRRSK